MPSINKVKEKTMATTAEFAGFKIPFQYVPGKMNAEYLDKLETAMENNDMDGSTDALFQIVTSWDLTEKAEVFVEAGIVTLEELEDEDGNIPDEIPIPRTAEACRAADVPLPLFAAMQIAIQQDMTSGGNGTKKGRRGN